ncbi:MAG: RIP metalloprotease RseP [Candidatus Omnitrophica bacterium]|nr:RIP metalloprotease RseP [Candidatus Omnitrophota bacterium]
MIAALASVFVLGLLVIVHEVGHFLVARWAGVRILRFSIGFGPRLLTWTRGHTEYAVSAIPLGGYVKMAGEQRAQASSDPWEYLAKPVGTRAKIVFAGPLVNYLVAFLSLWVVFVIGYPELLPVVGKVMDGMPAHAAGMHVGDRIQTINDRPIDTWDEMTKLIYDAPGQILQVRIERSGAIQTVSVTPQAKRTTDPFGRPKTIGLIGIAPSGAFASYRVGPLAAFGRALHQQLEWTTQTLLSLWSLATGKLTLRDSVTGPIGLVYLTAEAVRMGVAPLLFLISLFSLSLAIFNLFPIPILDGGHLLFLAIEKLRGRPVSLGVQERSFQVSFVLLAALVLLICINDVNRFGLLDKVMAWVRR